MEDSEDPTAAHGSRADDPAGDDGDTVVPGHRAGGSPSTEEAHAADAFLVEQDPADAERVAEHHHEMDLLGAEVRGEGRID